EVMPAPKATSHGFGGAGGAAGALTFMSAASAGVASATAATAVKRNFFIGCPFQYNATPAVCCCLSDRDFVFPVVASPRLCTKRNNPRRPARRQMTRQLLYFWANRTFSDGKNPSVAIPTQRPVVDYRRSLRGSYLPARSSEPKSGGPDLKPGQARKVRAASLPQAAAAFLRLASSRASTSATVASMTALRRPFCAAIACTSLSARSIF